MGLSLNKGEVLSLVKDDGGSLTSVTMGLGWDAVKKKRGLFGGGGGDIDLDASVIMFDARGNVTETVFFNKLDSSDGSIHHTGDNLTGDGDGDDEQILVRLHKVNSNVESLAFVITSYSGQKFDQIENVYCRLVDTSAHSKKEVARYNLREQGSNTAQIMAIIRRNGNGWVFKAVGEPTNGKTPRDVVSAAARAL